MVGRPRGFNIKYLTHIPPPISYLNDVEIQV